MKRLQNELSASLRVEETVIHKIGVLARRLNISKKKIIENAVMTYADDIDQEEKVGVFERTFGAWHRKEPTNKTVDQARSAFRNASGPVDISSASTRSTTP